MKTAWNVPGKEGLRRIIVPHDLTWRSDRAVQWAGTIADAFHSSVMLIHVIDPDDQRNYGPLWADDRQKILLTVASRLLPADVKSEVRVFIGEPRNVMLIEAKKSEADLLILTVHPFTAAACSQIDDKIAEQIVHQASCPVLTVQVPAENEFTYIEWEARTLQPHNLGQYCEFSRILSKENVYRPAYMGYSRTPTDLLGMCH